MANGSGFEINPTGVKAFGSQLKSAVDKDIAPTSERIKQNLLWHPVFGERTGSPAVQTAATKYHAQMRDALKFLDDIVHNTSAIAQAAQDVVAAYQKGDELSAAEMSAVIASASGTIHTAEEARIKAEQVAAEEAASADAEELRDLHRRAG